MDRPTLQSKTMTVGFRFEGGNEMLTCEGYKMFWGRLLIVPVMPGRDPYTETGVCLYKPEHDCWYINGSSYPADICRVVEDYSE